MTHSASRCIQAPIGPITIYSEEGKVTSVAIGKKSKDLGEDAVLNQAEEALRNYFAGSKANFRIPTKVAGTEFQKAVWEQIGKLGFGKSLTYGEIAEAIGKPKASRAVGAAVGSNPIPLLVGCHRVLGSSSKITGYTGGKGIRTKAWLLDHEGIEYKS